MSTTPYRSGKGDFIDELSTRTNISEEQFQLVFEKLSIKIDLEFAPAWDLLSKISFNQ
nr:hypothetical protein [Candidatus Sigynarchaeota archaeon]